MYLDAPVYIYGASRYIWRVLRGGGNPFKTVCLPLSYSGNPGVNAEVDRGSCQVHHTRVHELVNYPGYVDCSIFVRLAAMAAAVFCAEASLALLLISLLCLWLVLTLLRSPPYRLAYM
jgi:hypothetical protein